MPKLKVGDEAPDFEAKLSTGDTFRLSDYHGKRRVILYFYPRDFTPGCTREACSFRDYTPAIQKLEAEIIGVSLDSEQSHQKFIEAHRLNFPLISDKAKKVSRAYGVLRLGGYLFDRRITFVIDKQGLISHIIHSETNIDRHLEGAIAALKQLEKRGQG